MAEAVRNPGEMIERVARALREHDLDELLSFYETEAVLIRQDGSEARGLAAIRAEYASYLEKTVAMTAAATWVHVAGDIAVVRGRFSITLARRNGDPIVVVGEPIEVLRRQPDGSWLYLIDHGSGADPD